MSRLKGIHFSYGSIYQRRYTQVIPSSTVTEASNWSYRYPLCTVSASQPTNVNASSGIASGEAKGSGEQSSTDPTKKPVRGGSVSWMSLLLLIATGTGITIYYDNEKKQHIEEGKAGIDIVPVFISVDPERDTVEQVHDYVKEFHSDLVGLTGTPDEIRQVARAYRVYYMKTEEEGTDYLVDHSIIMYLMDPNMKFIKFFGKNYDADTLAEGIVKEISEYQKQKR